MSSSIFVILQIFVIEEYLILHARFACLAIGKMYVFVTPRHSPSRLVTCRHPRSISLAIPLSHLRSIPLSFEFLLQALIPYVDLVDQHVCIALFKSFFSSSIFVFSFFLMLFFACSQIKLFLFSFLFFF